MKILISGGTGLIGKELVNHLINRGDEVVVLSRSEHQSNDPRVSYVTWDIEGERIDTKAYEGVDAIIHLAGAGVADKRWSEERKDVLYTSRVKSAQLILNHLPENHTIKTFISASGINFYGTITTDKIFTEDDPAGKDFLAELSLAWEAAANLFEKKAIRVVKLRTPMVLAKEGGALPTIAKPIKMLVGAPLGSGKQWVPWVTNKDLVRAYIHAIDHPLEGAYNVVASEHITNKELTKRIAKVLKKPLWLPKVPSFVMNLILGKERAGIVLEGSRANSDKLRKTGFKFKMEELDMSEIL